MEKRAGKVMSGALHVAGDVLKFGIGLGALGATRLNAALRDAISNGSQAVKSASATVGGGLQDARDASGHVAEAAEALIVEFGQSFQGQAGVPTEEKPAPEPDAKPTAKSSEPAKKKSSGKPRAKARKSRAGEQPPPSKLH